MDEREKPLGHITFRLRPEFHGELLRIARTLNMDLSGLVNTMLMEATPIMRARAAELEAKQKASESPYPVEHWDWLLVERAMLAGFRAKHKEKLRAMRKAVADIAGAKHPTMTKILMRAEYEMTRLAQDGEVDVWLYEHGH